MRIWDIDPGYLNDLSLLGEHRELHGIYSILVHHKKGYARHPETLRWRDHLPALAVRHGLLTAEMTLRGFRHRSPLTPPPAGKVIWPESFIDEPGRQYLILGEKYRHRQPGRIPLPRNSQQLWANHKYSIMARSPDAYRQIGPLVAAGALDLAELADHLAAFLRRSPAKGRLRNAVLHLWGYVADLSELSPERNGVAELLREIGGLALRHRIVYLLASTALGELRYWAESGAPHQD